MTATRPTSRRLGFLFLGGAKRLTMARHLERAAAAYGIATEFTSYELSAHEPIAAIATIVEGLRWSDPAIVDDLKRVVEDRRIDVVLPFVDGAIEIAAELRSRVAPSVYIPGCSAAMAAALYDKAESAKLFEEAGIAIPATWHRGSALPFPLIAKPRRGSASAGIKVIRSESSLNAIAAIDDYLIQSYIEGAIEYSVDCFVTADGSKSVFSPRRRIETLGGEVTRTVTVDLPGLVAEAETAARSLGLTGPFTMQYLATGGRFLLMEINPRLGGGVTASIAAGASIASMIVEEAAGLPVTARNAAPGVATMRCFQDVTFHDPDNTIITHCP